MNPDEARAARAASEVAGEIAGTSNEQGVNYVIRS